MFIGAGRGGLTPTQRAEVAAPSRRAGGARRPAASSSTCRSAAPTSAPPPTRSREIRSILAAAGVPPHARRRAALSAADPARSRTMRLNYPQMTAEAGPCGLWPDDLGPTYDRELLSRTSRTGISAAPRSAISPPWSTTRPTWCSRAPKRRPTPRAAPPCSTSTARARAPRRNYPDANKGKISDVGK